MARPRGAFEPAGEQEPPAAENLARTASYTYSPSTEKYVLTAENDPAYSSDADCKKMNDGVRGDATGADMTNWTVFEPIPWMNPDNASNYNNDPLCAIFDLGAQKSITGYPPLRWLPSKSSRVPTFRSMFPTTSWTGLRFPKRTATTSRSL